MQIDYIYYHLLPFKKQKKLFEIAKSLREYKSKDSAQLMATLLSI